jgi:hypothetical protein
VDTGGIDIVIINMIQSFLVFLGAGVTWIQAGEWSRDLDNQGHYGASAAVVFSAGVSVGVVCGLAIVYWLTGITLWG